MKKRQICYKCGIKIDKKERLCSKCSPYGKAIFEAEEPSFILTNEISEGNLNLRLKEGFGLLSEQ